MAKINDIHNNVFNFLEEYREFDVPGSGPLLYTFRKSNQFKRLDSGYWFYGNENYVAISFWDGMDWKNKTPTIFFWITSKGKTLLTITCKDSIRKAEICRKYLVDPLGLKQDGSDRWTKEYDGKNYLDSLGKFLEGDKLKVDKIIRENQAAFISEDPTNSIGFIKEPDFNKWFGKIQKYRENEASSFLPYSLMDFSVEKYVPIEKVSINDIPQNVPFIIFVGENGSGKSSLLKSLATALGNKFYKEQNDPENSGWIINYCLNIHGTIRKSKITVFEPVAPTQYHIPFVGFGPSRLIIQNTNFRFVSRANLISRLDPLRSIFFPDAVLKDINRWIVDELAIKSAKEDVENITLRFQNIKQLLITIIPNLYDIREVPWDDTQELLYFEEDLEGNKAKKGVIFEHLSSGLKSLIAMLGDMMLRLFDQQPEVNDPAELSGIVLIDEIDIHLHPKWQKKVPEILAENFPNIQFIVTTHSPIPLLGVPKESRIYVVKRNVKTGVSVERMDDKVMFSEILPNAILTSPIFGLDDITPVSKDKNRQTHVEDKYSEIALYQKIEDDVNKYMTNARQEELINLFKNEK